ncbi:MAG: sigma-70 family RNA polymerase sigma factor [Tannerella sp.]|jgi:RNA polymerase sigma-70 factor (ECF subfamily)|nr:sigma-70 family RNA polymerase sigma factor [Tannerella sp.]
MSNDDYFYVKCLASDDEKAFVALYGKYHRKVYFSALRFIRSEETAKDITQTVFMKIWEYRRRLNPDNNFAAYLNTVCRNAIFDELKREALDDEMRNELQYTTDEAAGEDDFREKYYQLLEEAIATLPSQRRTVFEACKLKKQSYDLVARLNGISRSTVQDHIVKANKTIREYIQAKGSAFLAILFYVISQQ